MHRVSQVRKAHPDLPKTSAFHRRTSEATNFESFFRYRPEQLIEINLTTEVSHYESRQFGVTCQNKEPAPARAGATAT